MITQRKAASSNRRVLLVNPNQMKPGVAPLALDYLGSALQEQGFTVDLLDLCFAPNLEEAVESHSWSPEPLLVAITLRNTDDTFYASGASFLPALQKIVEALRRRTAAPILLGGAGFSVMPEAVLRYCGLDLGLWGEGEQALPRLATLLAKGGDYRQVPGLVYRTSQGFQRHRPTFLALETMSPPQRNLIDNKRYFVEGGMAGVETKRGCPQACTYCADPVGKGHKLRRRSPQSVAEEVEALLAQGIDHFHLCDSEFNLPETHAREVCREFIRRRLGERVRWYAYASPVPFSRELAQLCRGAGCAGIDFGVDSGHDGMLHSLGRDFTAADLERTAQVCQEEGLIFMYDLLLGGPGETPDSLAVTIETMKRLSPHRVGASLGVRIFPGTRLAALVRKEGPLPRNPNLRGAVIGNADFSAPVFYLSAALGEAPEAILERLVAGDGRFFLGVRERKDRNYNYNENAFLVEAIQEGYRGAFWDILRRKSEATKAAAKGTSLSSR